jgi:hypothetical protein
MRLSETSCIQVSFSWPAIRCQVCVLQEGLAPQQCREHGAQAQVGRSALCKHPTLGLHRLVRLLVTEGCTKLDHASHDIPASRGN